MFIQSFTISLTLLFSAHLQQFVAVKQGVIVMLWITVIITLVSGVTYMVKAGPAILAK